MFPAESTALVKTSYEPRASRFGRRRLQVAVPAADSQCGLLHALLRLSRAARVRYWHFLPSRFEIETWTRATKLVLQPLSPARPRTTCFFDTERELDARRVVGRVVSTQPAAGAGAGAGAGVAAGGAGAGGGGSSVANAGVPAIDRHPRIAASGM